MVLSIGKIGIAHAGYYLGQAEGREGYYTDAGEKPGRWAAAGAMNVTAGSFVTSNALRAALSCHNPGTGEQLGRKYEPGGRYSDALGVKRRRKAMSAYDMTYSVPKSVSVAWAVADDDTRAEIEAAFDASTDAVIAYLQRHAVASRAGAGGTRRVEVPDGAAVARFDHRSSRAGDPQLHAHLLFMNRVLCEDGVWRTLNGRLLYSHAMPASLYGAAVLRVELSRRLGWNWDRVGANLHAEIAGSDRELSTMWSQRSREVTREAQRRVREFEASQGREPTTEERLEIWDQATVASRASKKLHPLGGDPHQRWRQEAVDAGVEPDALIESYRGAQRVRPGTYDRPEVVVDSQLVHVADDAVEHLAAVAEQIAAGLSDADIDKAVLATITASGALAATWPAGGAGVDVVDRLGGALRSELHNRLVRHNDRWYSPGLLAAEVTTAAWLSSPAVDTAAAEARAARLDTEGLGDDQTEAARRLISSPTTGAVVVGPAGSGKTAMLARVADAAGHHSVVATAPTAVAAATLGAALGVRSDTVARLLTVAKNKPNSTGPRPGAKPNVDHGGSNPIPAGGTVIIDEASQLSTRDLASVCGLAADAGARVILVGDPAQQGSISAGGMFAALAESRALTTVGLAELWRFEDPNEAAVTVKLRAGDRTALDYHRSLGRVSYAAHAEIPEAAAEWWQHHAQGSTALSAPTRALVEEINAEIAARRVAAGETGEAISGEGSTAIRVGDIAVTRRNSRSLVATDSQWVKNGDRWVVEGSSISGGIKLRRCDSNATVQIPPSYAAEHLQLGYAVTQTRAQSITVDAAFTVATASTRLSELYVGLTRGTRSNHLLVVTDEHSCDEDSPPDQLDPDDVLDAIFARRGHQTVAADPAAGHAARDAAGAHLAAVADTGHTEALPVPAGFNAGEVLARSDQGELRRRAEDLESYVEAAIEAWAAQALEDEQLQQHDDSALLAFLDELQALDAGAVAVPNVEDPTVVPVETQAAAAGDHPHTADDEPAPRPAPPPLPPEAYRPTPAAAHYVGAGPQADEYDRLGLPGRHIAYNVFDLGTSQLEVRETVDTHPEPYRLAPRDNPALVQLVAAHQHADHAGDVGDAARLAALVAAVADPPLRRELLAHPDVGAAALAAGDDDWARTVRRDVLHRRAAAWGPTLDALSARRETLRNDVATAIDSGAFLSAVDTDTLTDHDRTLWAARCLVWLDNDATAEGLADLWRDTNTSLAAVAAGDAPPCGPAHRNVGDAPWHALAEATPPTPADVPQPAHTPTWTYEPPRAAFSPADPTHQLRAAVRKAAAWYHHQLLYSADAAEARHYLQSRGIGPDDWARWQLGWAPDQWRALTNHIANDRCAVDSGLAAESKNGRVFDVMRGRVILPISDPDGSVVAFAGRTINNDNPDAPKYLNTRTTALWSKSATLYGLHQARTVIADSGTASIVEGYLDVLACHRAGITNAVAACGTAVTAEHISALDAAGAHQLHTAFDGDAGGRKATRAALRLARDRGLPARVVNMPSGTDPDDLSSRELHHLWDNSEPQPWAAITAQLQADPDLRRSIEARVRATDAVLDETTRSDPLTRLVALHQTAVAHGHRFSTVLAHEANQPATASHTVDAGHPMAHAADQALTYGVTDTDDPQLVQDIAQAVTSLQTDPNAGREAALSR